MKADFLARNHVSHLGFFEIGRDVHLIEGNDSE